MKKFITMLKDELLAPLSDPLPRGLQKQFPISCWAKTINNRQYLPLDTPLPACQRGVRTTGTQNQFSSTRPPSMKGRGAINGIPTSSVRERQPTGSLTSTRQIRAIPAKASCALNGLIGLLLLIAVQQARAADGQPPQPLGFGILEVVTQPDGTWSTQPSYISPADLAAAVHDNIPSYQSILAITDSCYSGTYLDAFEAKLSGDVAAVGPSSGTEPSYGNWDPQNNTTDGYIDRLFSAFGQFPNDSITQNHQRAVNGDPYGPTGKNVEHPQIVANGAGANIKLKNGNNSNHALIVNGLPAFDDNKRLPGVQNAFQGYTSTTTLNFHKGPTPADGNPNPNWATKDNLTTKLKGLGQVMNANEHLTIVLLGQTVTDGRSTGTANGQSIGVGQTFTPAQNTDSIPLATQFSHDLFSGPSGLADPANPSFESPFFYLRTAHESATAGSHLDVFLGGQSAGEITLAGTGSGYYTLSLSEGLLSGLSSSGIPSSLDVRLDFSDPNGSFQLTTSADLDSWASAGSNYGMGLGAVFNQVEVVPEPSPSVLALMAGLVALVWLRRTRTPAV